MKWADQRDLEGGDDELGAAPDESELVMYCLRRGQNGDEVWTFDFLLEAAISGKRLTEVVEDLDGGGSR